MQPFSGLLFILGLSLCLGVNAGPLAREDTIFLQNGNDANILNAKFKILTPASPCGGGEAACVNDKLAQCVNGRFVLTSCSAGMVCRASPKMSSPGTTIGCTTESENRMRILATRAVAADDPTQSSACLDATVISTGFQSDGQSNITSAGQSPSRTSPNNWINYCLNKTLTNGQQVHAGSCNNAPIGDMPSVNNIPSAKFIFPPNFEALAKSTTFTVKIAINNLATGSFTNPDLTFMSSPLELHSSGNVIGHSHVVVEKLAGFGQTTPTDPKTFVFFKALNDAADANGVLSANVTGGLPAGFYRITTFHTGGNHQPIAVPLAQRGAMSDMVYFSVI